MAAEATNYRRQAIKPVPQTESQLPFGFDFREGPRRKASLLAGRGLPFEHTAGKSKGWSGDYVTP